MNPDDRVLLLPMEGLLDRLTEALSYPASTTIDRTIARADAQRAISLLGGDNLDLPTRKDLGDASFALRLMANEHALRVKGEPVAPLPLETFADEAARSDGALDRIEKALG